jgi:hypothetical protein
MEDVSLAPEYGGVALIIFAISVISIVAILISFGKMRFTGPYAADIMVVLNFTIGITAMLAVAIFVVRWLVKSLLVKYGCDSGSGWTFKNAASVTGYVYLVNVVMGLIGLFVIWSFIPSIVIDTTDLEAALVQLANYEAQIAWLQIVYTIPTLLIELVWKSYLGALGAHFGTRKMCSMGQGVGIFLILGLIGLALNFVG